MMLVIMKPDAGMRDISAVIARVEDLGCKVHLSEGKERTVVGVVENGHAIDREALEQIPGC